MKADTLVVNTWVQKIKVQAPGVFLVFCPSRNKAFPAISNHCTEFVVTTSCVFEKYFIT